MDNGHANDRGETIETALVDASDVSLDELVGLGNPQLLHALDRLLQQRRATTQIVVAGHGNGIQ